ncbi:MAG TPA: 6-bladed beta-propeller [bacterium]
MEDKIIMIFKKGAAYFYAYRRNLVLLIIMVNLSCATRLNTGGEKAVLFWPPPPEKPRIEFVRSFNTPDEAGIKASFFQRMKSAILGGDQINKLISPHGIWVDKEGRIYVADTQQSAVIIYDVPKKNIKRITKAKDGVLVSPVDVCCDPAGNIYVSDSALAAVFVFDSGGNFRYDFSNIQFQRPTGLFCHGDTVFVVDTLEHNLVVASNRGEVLMKFGIRGKGKGEFNYPTDLWVDSSQKIFVADTLNFRIQIFDSNGSFLNEFGKNGDAYGDTPRPKAVSMDSDGNIYVVDAVMNGVELFDNNGKFLMFVGGSGSNNGQFLLPAGVFITTDNYIYISDMYNHRVQVFRFLTEEKKQ